MALRNPRSRRGKGRSRAALAAAGLLIGAAAGLAKRAGLDRRLGFGGGDEHGASSPSVPIPLSQPGGAAEGPHEPGPSNYDVGGPPSNTATSVPVPPPAVPSPIDEDAEEAAAAAEAAGIGGEVSPYASSDYGAVADEDERPLVEHGGGTAEGFEQALAEQVEAAEPTDTASEYEKQIVEAIELQDNPHAGESDEALGTVEQPPLDVDQPGDDFGASATGASSEANQEQRDSRESSEGQNPT